MILGLVLLVGGGLVLMLIPFWSVHAKTIKKGIRLCVENVAASLGNANLPTSIF